MITEAWLEKFRADLAENMRKIGGACDALRRDEEQARRRGAALRKLVSAARLVPIVRLELLNGKGCYRCVGCGAVDEANCEPGCWAAYLEGALSDAAEALGPAEAEASRETRKGGARSPELRPSRLREDVDGEC